MTAPDAEMSYNAHVDDMDSYFDFNQGEFHSPVPSTKSPAGKASPRSRTIDPLNTVLSHDQHADERPVFTGPSHEYGRFRQQTGLPNGAISNVSAMNDFQQNMMGNSDFGMGYNSGFNMDLDFANSPTNASGLPAYFYPTEPMDEFVDPGAIAPQQPPQNRLRPGMHSQQAEQAKADAMAKQQRQQQIGQQIMQQREQESEGSQGSARRSTGGSDPVVEERISRLLDQMRNKSAAGDDVSSPNDDNMPHIARMKKDEEDMDEDERLLASEEGKKLTSKERRQLRNKVSARAFRSRRKEYITQLEGEVAGKNNECTELKMKNKILMDQNAQLTQLTQTLLRHPAFNTFLEDMSNDPSILAPVQQQQQPQENTTMPPQQTSQPKDVDPYQTSKSDSQHNESVQIGMSMVPENHFNFSMLNLGGAQWPSSQFQYQQPQVFSVLQIPEGPSALDLSLKALSGKTTAVTEIDESEYAPEWTPKVTLPSIRKSKMEKRDCPVVSIDESAIKDDPTFALYIDSSTPSAPSSTCTIIEAARFLENSLSGKSSVHFPLLVTPTGNESRSIESIDRLFAAEQVVVNQVKALTNDLQEQR